MTYLDDSIKRAHSFLASELSISFLFGSGFEMVRLRSKCEYYNEFASFVWKIFSMDDKRVQSAICDVLSVLTG